MARIVVDASTWPIARVTLPSSATDDEVRRYLDELRKLRERREPYALIVDANASKGFSATQRQMQADYVASGLPLSRRFLRAFAFVASSTMQRGMLTAIFWLNKPDWPHQTFRTVEEATAWVTERMADSK